MDCPLTDSLPCIDANDAEHKACLGLLKLRKFVFCRAVDCAWNYELPEGHFIKWNNTYVPLGKDDAYPGICGRREIGVTPRDVSSTIPGQRHWIIAGCDAFSDRNLKGHKDITRLMPKDAATTTQYHRANT